MTILVLLWGLEFIVAKRALEIFPPLILVFFKYMVGFITLIPVKLVRGGGLKLSPKYIPLLVLCVLCGDVFYYYAEYSALSYISVAAVTIILAFVPMLSVVIEKILFHRQPTAGMVVGILVCVAGIVLVIGIDINNVQTGKASGYILAGLAVIAWNIYNFCTEKLTANCSNLDLTMLQLLCTTLILAPYVIANFPPPSDFTFQSVGGAIYLGIFSSAVGFLIYVNALSVIGSTSCALFSNFLPVTSSFFGWALLGEKLTALQTAGGVVVVASACYVIKRRARSDGEDPAA
jgi:drug/metabolite transporter (DMT)-like permease